MKNSYIYTQSTARLQVEGLPDTSLGQSTDDIGILTSWKLEIVGFPDLEGKKTHLASLMNVVLPYVRNLISGYEDPIENNEGPISIKPISNSHQLTLKSSQPDVKPLSILVDDSMLADLTRCLDELRFDSRVKVDWNISPYLPLSKKQIRVRQNKLRLIFPPFVAFGTLLLISILSLNIPAPIRTESVPDRGVPSMKND